MASCNNQKSNGGAKIDKTPNLDSKAEGIEALWTQYGVSDGVLKMSLHTNLNPLKTVSAKVELWIERKDIWTKISESEVEALTVMAVFSIEDWNNKESTPYRVVCG